MRSRALATAVVAATAVAGVAVTTSTSAQDPGPRTVTFVTNESETAGAFARDDIKPTSRKFKFTIGDRIAFSSPIVTKPRGKRIGTAQGTCTATAKGPADFAKATFVCSLIYQVAGGTLSASALLINQRYSVTAVGGTGIYAGARGAASVKEAGDYSIDTYTLLP